MEVKTITETSRTFHVVVVHKGKEQKVCVTREPERKDGPVFQMDAVDGEVVKDAVKDFLVDTINSYLKTGKIPEGHREAAYTTNEVRQWICPHCGKENFTEKVEQGYPLPQCQHCREQSDWGNKGR